jgi:hypothetical protein
MIPFVSIFLFYFFLGGVTLKIRHFLKGGVGFIAALWMKALKLETVTDEVCKKLHGL